MKTSQKNVRQGWLNFLVILVLWLSFPSTVFGVEDLQETTTEFVQIEVTREDVLNYYSDKMEFSFSEVIVQSKFSENILVCDILENIQVEELKNEYLVEEIYFTNELGEILELSSVVEPNSKLVILGKNFIQSYEIVIFGDYNQDGIVQEEDVEEAIEKNISNSLEVTTEDVSYIDYVVKNQTYENPVIEQEELEQQWNDVETDCYVGEEIIFQYSIHGLKENYVNTISGEILYDQESFQLENVYVLVNGEVKGRVQDQYFVYILDEYQGEGTLIEFHFLMLKGGEYSIGLQNIKVVMNGVLLNLKSNIETVIFVEEYGKGGDEWEVILPEEDLLEENTSQDFGVKDMVFVPNKVQLEENDVGNKVVATTVTFSNDCNIESLKIKGYDITFEKDVYKYLLEVENDVELLEFDIVLSDENAEYFIKGNENFQEGQNEVVITVLAEDGSTQDYVIMVHKKEKVKEEEKEEENEVVRKGISFAILLFLILSIVWCLYLFIKKDET